MTKHLPITLLALAVVLAGEVSNCHAGPPSIKPLMPSPPNYNNRLPSPPPFVPAPPSRPLPQVVPGPLGIGNPITDHGLFIPRGNGGVILEGGPHGGGATFIIPFRKP
jgi:hypothetical protein